MPRQTRDRRTRRAFALNMGSPRRAVSDSSPAPCGSWYGELRRPELFQRVAPAAASFKPPSSMPTHGGRPWRSTRTSG